MRFLLVLLLAGCSHLTIDASSRSTTGQAGLHVDSSSLGAVVVAGMVIAAAVDDAREPRPFPSFSTFTDWFRGTPPPAPLAPDRRISEQDCTKPIEALGGNLKCR